MVSVLDPMYESVLPPKLTVNGSVRLEDDTVVDSCITEIPQDLTVNGVLTIGNQKITKESSVVCDC